MTACAILAILDNIRAGAFRAAKNHYFAYHLPFIPSFRKDHYPKTKSVWEKVKPSALEHKGKDTAAEFDASLAAQESALGSKNDTALTNEARNGLEIVDALERLY